MFAVTVRLSVDPAQIDAFLPLMRENARASLEIEPDCLHFDICTDPARPGDVFLYEIYTDAAAFDTHLTMPHYRTFNEATAAMVTDKHVTTYTQVRT